MNAHTENHVITFRRDMDRALQAKSYANSTRKIVDTIATKSLTGRGWTFDIATTGLVEIEEDKPLDVARRYEWHLNVGFAHPTNVPASTEFASILFTLYGRAMQRPFGEWTLAKVDGTEYNAPDSDDTVTSKIDKELIGYADIAVPDDWDSYFSHLYGLDAQIKRVKNALQAAIASNFRNRFNVVLHGEPGCGKSDIALSLKAALGDDAVISFDATATTAAGLQKALDELEILPRIIILEELEKAPEATVQPLLSMLDQRGEIRKTTARGKIARDTKCLAIATVNNMDMFAKMQANAVYSRFPNRVKCPRPDRAVKTLILHREIEKIGGNKDWAGPALDYCDSHDITDPREVISICLCGGDDLLTGEYQKTMDATN